MVADHTSQPASGLQTGAALPDLIVIGAMKCATSAVHQYLDAHPDISMSDPKELNFFNGPEVPPPGPPPSWWMFGQWHRGLDWYTRQFDPKAPLRGEASPGYTSPNEPQVAERMASVVPDVRLIYLVRDPVRRAVSQYAHHRRDGTETRGLTDALLDPGSQYLSRSRYYERLSPFLTFFTSAQIHVVVQERLLVRRTDEVRHLYEHVRADPAWRHDTHEERFHVGGPRPAIPDDVERAFREAVAEDIDRFRCWMGDDLHEWRRS
jgi:Sulfotransferase family